MGQTLEVFCFIALLGLAFGGSALAADPPKEGSYDYTACWSGANNVIAFSKNPHCI
ncbi:MULTISPECIES: hypothetical protein [Bradyrhizobium]|nr:MULTISPECIES: hypothetical protein [Bradyrhizobium]WOH61868.1 hypothetical protein RX329_17945 [Bradyrhizobium sp. BWC-3-1]